ncbi:hypothetical protein HMPREF1980_01377 [Actinomyces sp. oral taxon 172 str. F0311]|nr:hypothetical protein HMPREF1980_01377 [Actinomyces sp. oral taxon 172 str. F0311]
MRTSSILCVNDRTRSARMGLFDIWDWYGAQLGGRGSCEFAVRVAAVVRWQRRRGGCAQYN